MKFGIKAGASLAAAAVFVGGVALSGAAWAQNNPVLQNTDLNITQDTEFPYPENDGFYLSFSKYHDQSMIPPVVTVDIADGVTLTVGGKLGEDDSGDMRIYNSSTLRLGAGATLASHSNADLEVYENGHVILGDRARITGLQCFEIYNGTVDMGAGSSIISATPNMGSTLGWNDDTRYDTYFPKEVASEGGGSTPIRDSGEPVVVTVKGKGAALNYGAYLMIKSNATLDIQNDASLAITLADNVVVDLPGEKGHANGKGIFVMGGTKGVETSYAADLGNLWYPDHDLEEFIKVPFPFMSDDCDKGGTLHVGQNAQASIKGRAIFGEQSNGDGLVLDKAATITVNGDAWFLNGSKTTIAETSKTATITVNGKLTIEDGAKFTITSHQANDVVLTATNGLTVSDTFITANNLKKDGNSLVIAGSGEDTPTPTPPEDKPDGKVADITAGGSAASPVTQELTEKNIVTEEGGKTVAELRTTGQVTAQSLVITPANGVAAPSKVRIELAGDLTLAGTKDGTNLIGNAASLPAVTLKAATGANPTLIIGGGPGVATVAAKAREEIREVNGGALGALDLAGVKLKVAGGKNSIESIKSNTDITVDTQATLAVAGKTETEGSLFVNGKAAFGYGLSEAKALLNYYANIQEILPQVPDINIKAAMAIKAGALNVASVTAPQGTAVAVNMNGQTANPGLTADKATFADGGLYAITGITAGRTYTLLTVTDPDSKLDNAGTITNILNGQSSAALQAKDYTTLLGDFKADEVELTVVKNGNSYNVLLKTPGGSTATEPENQAATSVLAAAPQATMAAVTAVTGMVGEHSTALVNVQPAFGDAAGTVGVWGSPFYRSSTIRGAKAKGGSGSYEYGSDITLGGGLIGVDYAVSDGLKLGLAINAGGGKAKSKGDDFNKVENDLSFFGVTAYGSYATGALTLAGDLGYTSIENDIEVDGEKLADKPKSKALSAGLTGLYKIPVGQIDVTPHLGLRYTSIKTDDIKYGDGTKAENDDVSLFQVPLGLRLSSEVKTEGGFTVTPSADLGAVFTFGDTDVDSKMKQTGGPATVVNADIVDKVAFKGAVGLKVENGQGFSIGLDYGLLTGGHQTDHSVSATLRYEF